MEEPGGRRIPLPWLLTPYMAFVIAGYVADIIGPHLILTHPLLEMFLNPRNRYLLLASPHVDVVPFYVVGFIRLVLTDPIGFIIGWQYGDSAIAWAEKKMGKEVRTIERLFTKAAPVIIFIAPSFYWCVLAGATRMRIRLFILLNVTGTIARLVLFRVAGDIFSDQLDSALSWIEKYQWWLVGISFVLVAVQLLRKGEVEKPTDLAAEIEGDE